MIFEVNRDEFIRAIMPSIEVANKNTLKDFKYDNLLTIKAELDKVILFSYGGTLSLTAPISNNNFNLLGYKCEEEGQATLYADDLSKFLASLPESYDRVKIWLDSNQLKISSMSKTVEAKLSGSQRVMPIVQEIVRPPNIGEKFDQDIEINREIFVDGVNSVIFAPAYEEKSYSYMCMLFEANIGSDQEVRFSAGTGGRFAVKSVVGKNIIINNSEARMIFPKISLKSIATILAGATQDTIKIRSVGADQSNNIPEHLFIEFDDMSLCVYGLEHFTKYPDLTKVLQHQYSNRVYSSLKEWKSIEKTISATKNRWNDSIHNTEIVVEENNETFKVTPQTPNANPTFINMENVDNSVVKGDEIWFRCNSEYLREMVVHGGNQGLIQFNFESQETIKETADDKQAQKMMKPVLIKFQENVDSVKNTVDNFYMFFSISTK